MKRGIVLSDASDVNQFLFAQRGQYRLAHALDLSALELSDLKRRHYSESSVRCTFEYRHNFLARNHLDNSTDLQKRLRVAKSKKRLLHSSSGLLFLKTAKHRLKELMYFDASEPRVFDDDVLGLLKASETRAIHYIKKCLRYFKLSRIHETGSRAKSAYTVLLEFLFQHCTDSALVTEFLKTVCVSDVLREAVLSEKPEYLKFILYHSQRNGFNLWDNWLDMDHLVRFAMDPINICIMNGCLKNLSVLVQNGIKPIFSVASLQTVLFGLRRQYRFHSWMLNNHFSIEPILPGQTIIPDERILLTCQAAYAFGEVLINRDLYEETLEAFRRIWRAIPVAYLKEEEIANRFISKAESDELVNFYKDIFEVDDLSDSQPRPLTHLCRCKIRELLLVARGLPENIDHLPLPAPLKSFLNLNC